MSDYSRGDYADLPAGTTDLENNYSAPDLTAIASNDNSTYANQTANNEIAIHQYKKTVTSQYTNILWSGKSSLAPSESPVILEVYNVTGTPAWEELDRDDSTAADTDFDLAYDGLATADYLDSGVITWRVYQAASAGPPVTYYIGAGTVGGESCDFTGVNDSYMSEGNPANNYCTAEVMTTFDNGTGNAGSPIFAFTGLSNISTGFTVTFASITFYITVSSGASITVEMRRVLQPWVNAEVNWGSYDTGHTWTTGGAQSQGNDCSATLTASFAITGENTYVIDSGSYSQLLTDVQDMITNPSTNYGWVITFVSGDNATQKYVLSSDLVATPSQRPYLTVTGS